MPTASPSTILYNLFTAKSGTGKSTHTRYWLEAFGNRAAIINDDKPFIRLDTPAPMICGAPWSGKHGLDTNLSVPLAGICITSIPTGGQLMLGSRVLRSGDVLTADQLSAMTFHAPDTLSDSSAQMEYLPIWENRVASCAAMSIAIRGKQDKAPTAEDFAVETYKNLPLTQKLKVSDPEGQALTYTVTRQPRRGTVTIAEDGSFTYTPKKNKVGIDSFVYTATDAAGKISRETTVTVTIVKPTDAAQYRIWP